MRPELILICLAVLSLSSFVAGQEKDKWERVYTLEDATIAINTTRVTYGAGGAARTQFRWNFSKPQSLEGSPEIKYKTRVEVIEFSCQRRRYRPAGFAILDSKGKTLFSKEADPAEEWKFVKAGGMMERLLGPACKLIEEKRP
jgi:hypothetical protein